MLWPTLFLINDSFVPLAVCASPQFLVSGENPVPDNRMTASSTHYDEFYNGYHSASEARLNNIRVKFNDSQGYTSGAWASDILDTNQFIQVDIYSYMYLH